MSENRPDPDLLLARLREEELKNKRGRLKIFFGLAAGVGKTYSMLETAQKLREQKLDVVVGYVETHGRRETEELLTGLEIIPPKLIEYRGKQLKEFDIDGSLLRKPKIILVDELAHNNAPGSRHLKRWQDVQELLEAGIDVFTTLNVQHVESLNDVVNQITNVSVQERVPDSFLESAYEIELVDLPPDDLLERLKEGKVYVADQAKIAVENFFRKGNLIALRELSLRYTAERVVAEMEDYRQTHAVKSIWPAAERILVCVSKSPLATKLVRAGKRMSEALHASWTVLYVEKPDQISISARDRDTINQTIRLAEQLGAETLELSSDNISQEIIKCANQYNTSKIIIGKPARPRWKEIMFGSVVDDVIRLSGPIDVYVITGDEGSVLSPHFRTVRTQQKLSTYFWTILIVAFCTGLARLMSVHFELANIVMIYLLGIVVIAVKYGRGPSILASIISVLIFDFVYVPPYFSFAVADTQYVVTFVVMLIVGLVISTLAVTIKLQAENARLREMRTAALYSMSKELSSTLDMKDLVEISLRHIAYVFDSQNALFIFDQDDRLMFKVVGQGIYELKNIDNGIVAWVHHNKQPAGLGTDTLPGAKELYLPLIGARENIGVLVTKPRKEDQFTSPEQFRLLETFANQIALSCERAQLSEK